MPTFLSAARARASRHPALVTALGIDAVGTGLSGPLLLLYLITVAELPIGRAGVLLSVAGIASLVVPAVVGQVVGRVGGRAVLVAAQVLQAAAMIGFLASDAVALLALSALVAAVGQRAFWSSVFAVVADASDGEPASESDAWFALTGMIQNTGFALGALLAGALLVIPGALPFQLALAANAASFGVSAVLLLREPVRHRPVEPTSEPRAHVLRDRPYLMLIAANTLFAVCSTVLGIGLPVYVLGALELPGWVIGPLLALNTVLGATCQGLAVHATRRWPRIRVLVVAGLIWAGWGLATAALDVVPAWAVLPGLIGTVVLYSVAELLHAPRSMALAADAAPPALRSVYLSWFQYSFAIATIAGPAAFALTFAADPVLPWFATAGLALVACLTVVTANRQLASRRLG